MKAYLFPGQGSQFKGMGGELFDKFAPYTESASQVLGYCVKTLCLQNPEKKLSKTQYTQPALYTISCLSYLDKIEAMQKAPDFLAGHSLGEYSALFAAGALDFENGLKLVQRRGELMSLASGGTMAAVLGCNQEVVESILKREKLNNIDIANYNAPTQIVLSGPKDDIFKAQEYFEAIEDAEVTYHLLNVSAPFHSRAMKPVTNDFRPDLDNVVFSPLKIPVIANISARPYEEGAEKNNLLQQIQQPVQWTETIRYLMGQGVTDFEEIGPGDVLTKLVTRIKQEAKPLVIKSHLTATVNRQITVENLGSKEFKKDYRVSRAYISGAMVRGIASKELVIRMAQAGYMSFFGAGGLGLSTIETNIQSIQKALNQGQPWGMNLLSNLNDPDMEMKVVDLYLRCGICFVEASAYITPSPALVKYRLSGLTEDAQGNIVIKHNVIGKLSRPEVAEAFLNPAPERIVSLLLEQNHITEQQAALAKQVPMADDICVEADSGGHTDMGISTVLLPAIIKLRNEIGKKKQYTKQVRVGAAGGIGTPEAAASAFILGADFIVTGSINQCTVEAGTSDAVKEMLQQLNVQDTAYAPAGDMFELGARVQVMKKGTFFPARANKLYELWKNHSAWEEIDKKTRNQIETQYFGRSFDTVYAETTDYFQTISPQEIEKANRDKKHKMALVFRWYFAYTMRMADEGNKDQRVNFQVHCGPALGAFNQWVKGSDKEPWKNRHVDHIANQLMEGTAEILNQRILQLTN